VLRVITVSSHLRGRQVRAGTGLQSLGDRRCQAVALFATGLNRLKAAPGHHAEIHVLGTHHSNRKVYSFMKSREQLICAHALSFTLLRDSAAALACALLPWVVHAQPKAEKSEIYASECRLGTESGVGEQYHALVYYPYELSLRVPGIVIGAEKSSADQVRRGALAAKQVSEPEVVAPSSITADWLKHLLQGGSRSVFLSHVVATDGKTPKLEFNAYGVRPAAPAGHIPMQFQSVPWVDCERKSVEPFDAYADSWQAISAARDRIRQDLVDGQFTHVLVIVMGWNTVQTEALQNFATITHNMQLAAKGGTFRPYVVAFTWPSQWDSAMVGSVLVRPASLGVKADDADEFAAGWLGAALRHAVAPAIQQARAHGKVALKVVGIGHSFGARALSHAVCRGTVLSAADAGLETPPLPIGFMDTLFSLQGAYSFNRFTAGGAGLPQLAYAPGCPAANRLVFTASANDAAAELAAKLPGPLWAGSLASWQRMERSGTRLDQEVDIKLCSAAADGSLNAACLADPASRFLYVDASPLIFYRSFGTGGGAHSDIYRLPMASMLWQFMAP
jgi:hypothetical protein